MVGGHLKTPGDTYLISQHTLGHIGIHSVSVESYCYLNLYFLHLCRDFLFIFLLVDVGYCVSSAQILLIYHRILEYTHTHTKVSHLFG